MLFAKLLCFLVSVIFLEVVTIEQRAPMVAVCQTGFAWDSIHEAETERLAPKWYWYCRPRGIGQPWATGTFESNHFSFRVGGTKDITTEIKICKKWS